jgi:SAM-dependent methyltransferase
MPAPSDYDRVPYLITSFPESHPRRLQSVAYLYGLETPPPIDCRVLELGCAVGGNIVPMAYSLPASRFVGIDIVASQIQRAKEFAEAAGVKNLDLRAASIMDLSREQWGEFDYIIAHGVFSWVPPDAQDKILQIAGRQLARNGVAYLSFNTYPGWHVRMWAREAMLFHTQGIADPIDRARAARDFIVALSQSPFASGDKSALLKGEVQYMAGKPETYILHDYLEPSNHPIYFHDFAVQCDKHGLQYLGDSLQNGTAAEQNWPAFKAWFDAAGDDIVKLEQYADFVRNRMFRRSIVCRREVRLDRKGLGKRAESMWAVAFLRQWAEGGGMSRFEHPRGGRMVTGSAPVRDALVHIARQFPRPTQLGQLLASAPPADRPQVARELLSCWMNGMIELYVDAPQFRVDPGSHPHTSAIARHLASQEQAPINLRHESINVDAAQRRLITLLDGTRSRDQLAAEVPLPRETLDRALEALATVALLEG